MGIREEKKERTRRLLSATALELFRVHGFTETRVQDIVERVGVSPATFFNYFPSKDAVLEAESDDAGELFSALLRHELARGEASVVDRLRQIAAVLGEYLSNDPDIARLLVTRTSLFAGSTGARADRDRASQDLLAQLIHQGQDLGELRTDVAAGQLAEVYMAVMMLTATNWLIEWRGPPRQRLTERLLDALDTVLLGMVPRS